MRRGKDNTDMTDRTWHAYAVGSIVKDRVVGIGVYSEEHPTSMMREIQFTLAQAKGDSLEEALRRAAYYAIGRVQWNKELLRLITKADCHWFREAFKAHVCVVNLWRHSGYQQALETFFLTGDLSELNSRPDR